MELIFHQNPWWGCDSFQFLCSSLRKCLVLDEGEEETNGTDIPTNLKKKSPRSIPHRHILGLIA